MVIVIVVDCGYNSGYGYNYGYSVFMHRGSKDF